MKCETTYMKTDEGKVLAILWFDRNRDDDPEVWDIVSRPPGACCCVTAPSLTAESGSLGSEPFETIEEAQDWAGVQIEKIKERIEAYRKFKQSSDNK